MTLSNTSQAEDFTDKPEQSTRRTAARSGPMPGCPMASMCRGMAEKPLPRFLLMMPWVVLIFGLVLILIGVLILFEPRVLNWLAATVAMLLGAASLVMANFMRKFGHRSHSATSH